MRHVHVDHPGVHSASRTRLLISVELEPRDQALVQARGVVYKRGAKRLNCYSLCIIQPLYICICIFRGPILYSANSPTSGQNVRPYASYRA